MTRRVMGNGVVSYATFDRTDRMLSLRYATSGGAGLAYFDYGRDVAGRILRIEREATAGYAIYYAYDNIDRLEAEVWRKTSDNSQVYGFWYSYDAANNRLQMRRETTAGVTWDSTYYQYAADNALIRRQVATPPSTVVDTYYGYDANGALTQVLEGANATYFGYGANQLVTRILPPAEAATYFSYDGRLNRYYIDKAGTQTYYLWDGLNQLEERDGSGTLLARYTQGNYRQYGIGSVVEVERHVGAATYYQYGLGDHRGTFYKITDQNQDVQIDYTLDAFGRQLAAPGGSNPAVPNDLIYQSNWLTLNIGGRPYGISMYRVFDFELGIFLQRDFLPYLNKYRAFSNNPVGQVDNNGLAPIDQTLTELDEQIERARSRIPWWDFGWLTSESDQWLKLVIQKNRIDEVSRGGDFETKIHKEITKSFKAAGETLKQSTKNVIIVGGNIAIVVLTGPGGVSFVVSQLSGGALFLTALNERESEYYKELGRGPTECEVYTDVTLNTVKGLPLVVAGFALHNFNPASTPATDLLTEETWLGRYKIAKPEIRWDIIRQMAKDRVGFELSEISSQIPGVLRRQDAYAVAGNLRPLLRLGGLKASELRVPLEFVVATRSKFGIRGVQVGADLRWVGLGQDSKLLHAEDFIIQDLKLLQLTGTRPLILGSTPAKVCLFKCQPNVREAGYEVLNPQLLKDALRNEKRKATIKLQNATGDAP